MSELYIRLISLLLMFLFNLTTFVLTTNAVITDKHTAFLLIAISFVSWILHELGRIRIVLIVANLTTIWFIPKNIDLAYAILMGVIILLGFLAIEKYIKILLKDLD